MAAEWAGFESVGQCEWADYPTKVLEKHWPNVARWRDIRSVTAESFKERTGLHTVTLVSGGFPCQPFSLAGNRKGKEDDRYLWPEMLRVIQELQPPWVIGENVAGIISMAEQSLFSELESSEIGSTTENMVFEEICQSLENLGYEVQPVIIPACSADAPHRRDRTIIMAWNTNSGGKEQVREIQSRKNTKSTGNCYDVGHSISSGCNRQPWRRTEQKSTDRHLQLEKRIMANTKGNIEGRLSSRETKAVTRFGSSSKDASDTDSQGLPSQWFETGVRTAKGETCSGFERRSLLGAEWDTNWWAAEPDVGRVANGIPSRVDRLKCLGNAVVPQQVYPILQAIADIESGRR